MATGVKVSAAATLKPYCSIRVSDMSGGASSGGARASKMRLVTPTASTF